MDKDMLVKRIAEIQAAVEQSVTNHHGLLGRLGEAKFMLEQLEKCEAVEVVGDVTLEELAAAQ